MHAVRFERSRERNCLNRIQLSRHAWRGEQMQPFKKHEMSLEEANRQNVLNNINLLSLRIWNSCMHGKS